MDRQTDRRSATLNAAPKEGPRKTVKRGPSDGS